MFFLLLEHIVLTTYFENKASILTVLGLFSIAYFTYQRSKSAAILWGNFVKSIFDIYLPDLLRKLEYPIPSNFNEEYLIWEKFSQMTVYHASGRRVQRIFKDME